MRTNTIDFDDESLFSPFEIKLFGREFEGFKIPKKAIRYQYKGKVYKADDTVSTTEVLITSTQDKNVGQDAKGKVIEIIKEGDEPVQRGEKRKIQTTEKIDNNYLNRKATFDDDSLLQQQVIRNQQDNDPMTLARIYCFAFEGEIYQLPKPTIFIVHGDGEEPKGARFMDHPNKLKGGSVDKTGVASRDWFFENDIKMWRYEKSAMTIRLDMVSGSLEDILLEGTLATMGGDGSDDIEMASREGRMASREGRMASSSGRMAFRARHRFK